MASYQPDAEDQPTMAGQKRKFEDHYSDTNLEVAPEAAAEDEGAQEDDGIQVNVNLLIPDNYNPSNDNNEQDHEESDSEDDAVAGDLEDCPTHDESSEPFPPCAIYDQGIKDLEKIITGIPQRFVGLMSNQKCKSATLQAHVEKAKNLTAIPEAEKSRIAILGGAGAGKSSLLNVVTGQPDMAKSVSQC